MHTHLKTVKKIRFATMPLCKLKTLQIVFATKWHSFDAKYLQWTSLSSNFHLISNNLNKTHYNKFMSGNQKCHYTEWRFVVLCYSCKKNYLCPVVAETGRINRYTVYQWHLKSTRFRSNLWLCSCCLLAIGAFETVVILTVTVNALCKKMVACESH